MDTSSYLWLIPALPLLGFIVNGTLGDKLIPRPAVGAIALLGPVLGFVLSVLAFLQIKSGGGAAMSTYFDWINTGNVNIGFGLQADPLSVVMMLNVTGVGSLIHLYSYGYMVEDPGFPRFMAYLNLFMTSMLILVMGDSLPLLFVGWEGVGLCSFLLIGFWFDDLANVDAARKAFVVNRVGDFAFLVGMFALFMLAGTLRFDGLEAALGGVELSTTVPFGPFFGWSVGAVITLATAMLFIGATGKSAQIPLYVWLPDAMAGPTPVSALIHAATMVTAGVYMVGRLDFLFIQAPIVLTVMGLVAALTAFFAGAIAFSQFDIKKVLAYSTVSQLGFMFAGMSTAVWHTGLFHVLTHAFFKALLFLGAGAVIHAMHHEQDVRKMGGLWKDLRGVAVLFLIGSLALAGFPLLAGFWSKDEIMGGVLYMALHDGGVWWVTFGLLAVTALMTAFYTTRLFVLTFFGEPADSHRHIIPVPWQMMVPLYVLAGLSLVGGLWLGSPVSHALSEFTAPVWTMPHFDHELEHHAHQVAMGVSTLLGLLGIAAGYLAYTSLREPVARFVEGPGRVVHLLSENKFFVDEIYDWTIIKPTVLVSQAAFWILDRLVLDRLLVEGSGQVTLAFGGLLRRGQSGALSVGMFAITGGLVALLVALLLTGVRGV